MAFLPAEPSSCFFCLTGCRGMLLLMAMATARLDTAKGREEHWGRLRFCLAQPHSLSPTRLDAAAGGEECWENLDFHPTWPLSLGPASPRSDSSTHG